MDKGSGVAGLEEYGKRVRGGGESRHAEVMKRCGKKICDTPHKGSFVANSDKGRLKFALYSQQAIFPYNL